MFFVLALRIGFNNVCLNENQTMIFDSKNSSIILMLPKTKRGDLIITTLDSKSTTVSDFIERFIHYSYIKFSIKQVRSKQICIPIWQLPLGVCTFSSFVMQTSYKLDLSSIMKTSSEPICIFSQIESNSHLLEINYPNTSIFDSQMRYKSCIGDCSYSTSDPFLIQIKKSYENTSLSIGYISKSPSVYCHLYPVVFSIGIAAIPSRWPGMSYNINCFTDSENLVSLITTSMRILCIILFICISITLILWIKSFQRNESADTQILLNDNSIIESSN